MHRSRTLPVDADELPAAIVYVVEEHVDIGPGMGIQSPNTPPQRRARRTLTARVEIRVDASAIATAPDSALDPYHLWMVQKIGADPTLGGLAHDCKETHTLFDAKQADRIYAASQTDFIVDYLSLSYDLTQNP